MLDDGGSAGVLPTSAVRTCTATFNQWVAFMNILTGKYCLQLDGRLCYEDFARRTLLGGLGPMDRAMSPSKILPIEL